MAVSVQINPKYEELRKFIEGIPAIFEIGGREIYHLRNVIKVFKAPNGMLVNVKRFHVPSGVNRLVYSWGIRKPKGERAFEYPEILLGKGIGTPEAIALIEERGTLNLLGYSYLITEQIDWGHTFYDFGNAVPGEYEEAAKALAKYAAHMHENEVLHKDFTPGNILWKRDEEGFHFSMVDINRMYFGPVDKKMGLLNLKKFWGPKHFTEILVEEYARLRGFDVQEALNLVLDARKKFWTRYQKKHEVPFKLEL